MKVNRRDFLASTVSSATGIVGLGSVTACSSEPMLKDEQISKILAECLLIGREHQETVRRFIEDLRLSDHTTAGPEETAAILQGERGQAVAERYVIQEFIRFSNYRLWMRRSDQTLGPALLDPYQEEFGDLNDPQAP